MDEKEPKFILQEEKSERETFFSQLLENSFGSYSIDRRSLSSCVLKIFIFDCFLKAGSFDQMGHFNFNAKAKYGVSLSELCGDNLPASDSNCLYSEEDITEINSFNSPITDLIFINGSLVYLTRSFIFLFNSSKAYAGEDNCKSCKEEFIIINLTGLSLKNEKSMFASTTNFIYHPSSLCLFQTRSFNSSPSLKQSSSVNSESANISSNFLSNNALLTFSDKNSLTASDQFNSDNESIFFFNSSGIASVIFGILSHNTQDAQVFKTFEENIKVCIFSGSTEISNPGGLIIKENDFGKISRTRNPLIFNLLQRIDFVEKVGSGIGRIRDAMAKLGLKEPKFDSGGFFSVTLFKPSDEQIGEISGAKIVKKGGQESSQKSSQKILELIRQNNKITIEELANSLKITDRAIKKNLAKLKEGGVIKRIGPDKGGYWEVVKEDE